MRLFKPLSSIVVITDNYWIGGRETFLRTYLLELKVHYEIHAAMIADNISDRAASLCFNDWLELGVFSEYSLANWIKRGKEKIEAYSPDFLWAQHYRLFPAWVLSELCGIPLLATFHGSLRGLGRPQSQVEAMGVTFAIHRADYLSAVSDEIAEELVSLGAERSKIRILPNKVRVVKEEIPRRTNRNEINLTMLARPQKLDHIREALKLLKRLREDGFRAKLTIYSGIKCEDKDIRKKDMLLKTMLNNAKIVGRRWLLRNPEYFSTLFSLEVRPPVLDSSEVIQKADVVLGMGRVILEGIAANRPSVLIGYDQVKGVVTDENFEKFKKANFSGRGIAGEGEEVTAAKLYALLEKEKCYTKRTVEKVRMAGFWGENKVFFEKIGIVRVRSKRNGSINREIENLTRAKERNEGYIEWARGLLIDDERITYYKLLGNGGDKRELGV